MRWQTSCEQRCAHASIDWVLSITISSLTSAFPPWIDSRPMQLWNSLTRVGLDSSGKEREICCHVICIYSAWIHVHCDWKISNSDKISDIKFEWKALKVILKCCYAASGKCVLLRREMALDFEKMFIKMLKSHHSLPSLSVSYRDLSLLPSSMEY